MSQPENAINVAELLARIDEDIKNKFTKEEIAKYECDDAFDWGSEFEKGVTSFSHTFFVQQLNGLKGVHFLNYYHDFAGSSFQMVKRAIRKINKCVIVPIVEQQTDANIYSTKMFYQLYARTNQLENEVEALKAEIERLKEQK